MVDVDGIVTVIRKRMARCARAPAAMGHSDQKSNLSSQFWKPDHNRIIHVVKMIDHSDVLVWDSISMYKLD